MAINLKAEAKKLVELIKKDPKKVKTFTKDPIKFVEKYTGLDLPDEKIKTIITSVTKDLKANAKKTGIDLSDGIDLDDIKGGIALISNMKSKTSTKKPSAKKTSNKKTTSKKPSTAKKKTTAKKTSKKKTSIDAKDIEKGIKLISGLLKK